MVFPWEEYIYLCVGDEFTEKAVKGSWVGSIPLPRKTKTRHVHFFLQEFMNDYKLLFFLGLEGIKTTTEGLL